MPEGALTSCFDSSEDTLHLVQALLRHEPDLQLAAVNAQRRNALMLATATYSEHANIDCVTELLKHSPGVQVEAADEDGLIALHLAAGRGHTNCVMVRLAAGGS